MYAVGAQSILMKPENHEVGHGSPLCERVPMPIGYRFRYVLHQGRLLILAGAGTGHMMIQQSLRIVSQEHRCNPASRTLQKVLVPCLWIHNVTRHTV